MSDADRSLFQLVEGLRYAFPNAMDALGRDIPGVLELAGRIGQRRNIAAYLASPRRQPFNEDGIFRHYPELDACAVPLVRGFPPSVISDGRRVGKECGSRCRSRGAPKH